MDRNQVIGLTLIFLIVISYFTFFAPKADEKPAEGQGKTEIVRKNPSEPVKALADTISAAEQVYVLENRDIKVEVSSHGAQVKSVQLKKYKTYRGEPLYVLQEQNGAPIVSVENQPLAAFRYTGSVQRGQDSAAVLTLQSANGPAVTYSLAKEGYVVSTEVQAGSRNYLSIDFPQRLQLLEKDFKQSQVAATINYYTVGEEFDKLNEASSDSQKTAIEQPVNWFTHKQKFFLAGLIQRGKGFTNVNVSTVAPANDSITVKYLHSKATLPASSFAKPGLAQWDYYFGPNKYKVLKTVAPDFERNVYLGWPIVRWLNKYVVVNVFDFLEKAIGNYGIIIVLLVLLIRVILLPLSFRSYISMAKMKVLKPEIDAIKEKHGEDMAAVQQEQMKLYQQVGINPLSGCIPLLLQLPVLAAMFNFFPSAIELRQEHLWWAEDLSTYDSILTLPFSLPFGYGDHVSLFTILMTISTLAITWYNNQTNTVQQQMVVLSYVMPLIFMFVLNSLPAGLSFYYLVSNLVSLAQQVGIRKFVDEGKIRARLEENKAKNVHKKPGGFAARLESAMRAAEEQRREQPKGQLPAKGQSLGPKKPKSK